ncbi:MAG: Unknown protein [uncultured Aureispira sp.]|uniref:Uncharacterized protein n=1 Tax=uncultured Aureispira sp. TaxID=1331704 RepID=A0A6S6RZX5_9BACT|nr:MAG: Unknown protein [uncultured Aureispira sp.]
MSKKKDSKDAIDLMLQSIEKVEAPMFLLTKIQARISQELEASVPVKYVWATALSLMILLMLNVWTIQDTRAQSKDNIAVIMEEMDLIPCNSFF